LFASSRWNRNKRTRKKPLALGVRRVRDDSTFLIQRDAVFSAATGVSLFNGSPLPAEPLPVIPSGGAKTTLLSATRLPNEQRTYSPDGPSMGNRQLYNKTFSSLGRRCSVSDKKSHGVHWWMRLRWDTIRVEESALCFGRLSLHRLPAKRGCTVCAVGISAAQGPGRDKR
jgi:hypothetical protein